MRVAGRRAQTDAKGPRASACGLRAAVRVTVRSGRQFGHQLVFQASLMSDIVLGLDVGPPRRRGRGRMTRRRKGTVGAPVACPPSAQAAGLP